MAEDRSASELMSELNEVRGQLHQLRDDLGFVARTIEPGQSIQTPRRAVTPEAIEELLALERRGQEGRESQMITERVSLPIPQLTA